MKKILYLLLISVFLLPLAVKADRDMSGELLLYSEETSVGSTVVFRVTSLCDNSTCDGSLKYDSDVLEYQSIDYNFPLIDVGPRNSAVNVVSNENGLLIFDFNNPDNEDLNYIRTSIIVKFTVIGEPESGKTLITYAPVDKEFNVQDPFAAEKEIKILASKSITVTECNDDKTENVENIDDTEKKNVESTQNTENVETIGAEKECPKCEEKKCSNLWFIIGIASLIVNAILLVVVIVISTKKKSKSDENKAESVVTDKSI